MENIILLHLLGYICKLIIINIIIITILRNTMSSDKSNIISYIFSINKFIRYSNIAILKTFAYFNITINKKIIIYIHLSTYY